MNDVHFTVWIHRPTWRLYDAIDSPEISGETSRWKELSGLPTKVLVARPDHEREQGA